MSPLEGDGGARAVEGGKTSISVGIVFYEPRARIDAQPVAASGAESSDVARPLLGYFRPPSADRKSVV